jgi:hypothetical protein
MTVENLLACEVSVRLFEKGVQAPTILASFVLFCDCWPHCWLLIGWCLLLFADAKNGVQTQTAEISGLKRGEEQVCLPRFWFLSVLNLP